MATRDQLATIVGRGLRTIAAWKAKGMPGVEGRYDVAACVGWAFCEGLLKFEKTTDDEERNETPHDRLERLKGDEKEIELARLRRETLDRDIAQRYWGRQIYEMKSVIDQLIDQIPAQLPTEIPAAVRQRARETIQAAVDDAYSVLSRRMADDEDENETSE